jgi:hypothetical protein
MNSRRKSIDRIAGRVYTRVLDIFTGFVSVAMLIAAVFAWASGGIAWIWALGAVVFGFVARASWRSRAGLGDIDFSG